MSLMRLRTDLKGTDVSETAAMLTFYIRKAVLLLRSFVTRDPTTTGLTLRARHTNVPVLFLFLLKLY